MLDDRGMATVEYAVLILAAAALALVMYAVVNSDAVEAKIAQLIQGALTVG